MAPSHLTKILKTISVNQRTTLCYLHHDVPSVMSSCTAFLASVTLSSTFSRLSASLPPSWRITIDKFRRASLCLLCSQPQLSIILYPNRQSDTQKTCTKSEFYWIQLHSISCTKVVLEKNAWSILLPCARRYQLLLWCQQHVVHHTDTEPLWLQTTYMEQFTSVRHWL